MGRLAITLALLASTLGSILRSIEAKKEKKKPYWNPTPKCKEVEHLEKQRVSFWALGCMSW